MVSDDNWEKGMKKQIYNTIAHSGIWFLKSFFPEYFSSESLTPSDRHIEYPFILDNLPSPPAKILDVGCSGSVFPLILKSLKYDTYGIDIREYYPLDKFFFIKDDICLAPFQNDFFDIVVAISSIEHIGLKGVYGQQEMLDGDIKAINEFHLMLKPGGLFLMTVPLIFADNPQIKMNHKIYNQKKLHEILGEFKYEIRLQQSPEADYNIALIKANKE